MMPRELETATLWWYGPQALKENPLAWPSHPYDNSDLLEIKVTKSTFQTCSAENPFSKFSKLTTLEKAYCLRFIQNVKSKKEDRKTGPLDLTEIKTAFHRLKLIAQSRSFPSEIAILKAKKTLTKTQLIQLSPFLDGDGLLRVGGRLTNLASNHDKVNPILLPSNNYLTKLIFEREYLRLLHAGPQLSLSSLRQKFWPLGGRNLARKTVHACIRCFRAKSKMQTPLMGASPKDRVNPSPPFLMSGVDYAGPILIKNKKGRGCKLIKAYICVFICFSTKAIHLEFVDDLTTESFMLALRRFIGRRSILKHIYSDNGKTFVGCKSQLKELGEFLQNNVSVLSNQDQNCNIEWHFIPAYSPHFGGLWETGVKSVKHHFKRVAGNAFLTYEACY